MAQPNVAREPSMEEILASIRRIIESNEPNAENGLPGPLPSGYGQDDADEPEEMRFVPDMAANDRGLPSRNELPNFPSAPPARPVQSERSLSLADVAARVRAASARQQEPDQARFAPASAATGPAAASSSAGLQSASQPSSPLPISATRHEEPVAPPAMTPRMPEFREPVSVSAPDALSHQQHTAPVPQFEPQRRHVPSVFEPMPPAARAEAPVRRDFSQSEFPRPNPKLASEPSSLGLPAKIEEAANLLSVEAGAQIAQSFSELAAVFNGMERRSLEDMAGDMLRPMLQEWLDDNLPTLVERLVREEIERVARGTRR